MSVTILEQGRCAQAASRAALGALWPPPMAHAGVLQQLHRESLWGYEAFIESLQNASGLRVDYLRRGKIELLNSAEAFRVAGEQCAAANASWPALGAQPVMEQLTATQIKAYEPEITESPYGAQLCRWSGQVHVDQLLEALLAACAKVKVHIHEGVRVDRLESAGDQIVAAHAGAARYAGKTFLLCAGVGMPLIWVPAAISPLITPVKGQALLLRARQEVIGHIIKSGPIFLVPWPDGRILVGSTTEPEAGFDTTNTAEGVAFLLHGATELVPALKSATMERVWAGLRPTGPKHRPLMGPSPTHQNVVICAGHFKIGIGLAPLAGELMAEFISTGRTRLDISSFAPGQK
jgi:glycine oxidase